MKSSASVSVVRTSFAAMGVCEPWFYLGAILFGVTKWQYARRRPATAGTA